MAGIAGATSATRDSRDDRIDRSTETQYAGIDRWADLCRPGAGQAVGEVRSASAYPSFHSTQRVDFLTDLMERHETMAWTLPVSFESRQMSR
jgi:hypothetical protein